MDPKNSPWKTHKSEIAHKNPYYHIEHHTVTRPDGTPGNYYVLGKKHETIYVVALDENQKIYLLEQYRYPCQTWSWEIPAGNIEDGEDSLTAAKRELQEETGIIAKTWTKLGWMQESSGYSSLKGDIWLAQNLIQTPDHNKNEEGIREVRTINLEEALDWIYINKITDCHSVMPITLANGFLKKRNK
ncbi:MAG: NUDIX hydrolase [Parcubacteria group bacterium Gr01-1014_18]|nr:MAG: NUDIX hydrolase [Parcubacteria group bacterium Greene0416_36]TSC80945.1 MAG: NUDIX hydrolase [Parcubacteria group bacterium Gr01-1014_18]TSC98712.1 MAG: NUDIX hydrolase [Parcubacteria group bacterium Greene1014_20]TSD06464.1 MAG: NUDIX hydrolase [Parcubacteria group bacterium Greene0714_2]